MTMMISDLSSKCRTCLCESNNSYHQLFGYVEEKYNILEMLESVVPQIDVKMTSQFSTLVCYSCVEKLLIGYKFQQSCIEAHNRAHDLLEIMVIEKDLKLEEALDPLTTESNFKVMEETCDVSVESDTQKEDLYVGKKLSKNRSADDSYARISKLNRRKDNFPCADCGKVFSSPNKLIQHKIRKHDNHEPNLTIIFDERTNEAIEQRAVLNREVELTPQTVGTDCENSGDKSDVFIPKSEENNFDVNGADEIEKSNIRKGNLSCEICGKIFDNDDYLRRHHLVHSRARPYECNNDAERNYNSPSKTDSLECPDCPRRFEKRASLAAHRKRHSPITSVANYLCTVCQRSFMSTKSLTEHITNKHPEFEKHKCDQCDKTFVLHSLLIKHLNRHKGKSNVVCVICGKEFAYKKTLKVHMRTHSGEFPFLCPQCGKTFRSECNLRQHIERHNILKKYQCPECPSRFKCKSYLVKHAITHSKAKPHVCDICGSHFTRTTSLQKHKLLHSGERPFKCDQCSMTFAVRYHLHRHIRTHTGEKPYKCKYCERTYAESGDLTKHLRTHVGENTYMCDQCPMAFKYQAELRRHQSQHYKRAQKLEK